jgi:hypothetical protein
MVGFGGGVPSKKHDICLGDIVVNASRDSEGGVFQSIFVADSTGFKIQSRKCIRIHDIIIVVLMKSN